MPARRLSMRKIQEVLRLLLVRGLSQRQASRACGVGRASVAEYVERAQKAGLLEAGWENEAGVRMLCGGEALPRELATRLLAGGAPLWNVYGPTETTIWSTVRGRPPGPASAGLATRDRSWRCS